MRDALSASGWNATLLENGTKEALERAVDAFARQAGPGDEAIFFYAGHGIQTEGINYLIPVDFTATDATDAKYRGVSADWVHEKLTARGVALNVMILDACRDNPFSATRSGAGGGLAEVRGARGSLVAFATGPGKTAADSPGANNGLFTGFLVEALRKPGLTHNDVFDEVRARVVDASRGAQIPWVNSSVVGRFVFNPGGGSDASRMAQAPPPVQALPKPVGDTQLDLSDLSRRVEAEEEWEDYQAKMLAAFKSTETFEIGAGSAELKATAWERFLSAYAQNNPLTDEDDTLRDGATARARRWKVAPAAAEGAPAGSGGVLSTPRPRPPAQSGPPSTARTTGKYVRADKPDDFMLFNEDGSVVLFQGGRSYMGTFARRHDNQLELTIGGIRQQGGREEGDVLIDPNGRRWVKVR